MKKEWKWKMFTSQMSRKHKKCKNFLKVTTTEQNKLTRGHLEKTHFFCLSSYSWVMGEAFENIVLYKIDTIHNNLVYFLHWKYLERNPQVVLFTTYDPHLVQIHLVRKIFWAIFRTKWGLPLSGMLPILKYSLIIVITNK